MNTQHKPLIIGIVVVAAALAVGYSLYTHRGRYESKNPVAGYEDWHALETKAATSTPGFSASFPPGFSVRPTPAGKGATFVNTKIKSGDTVALVSIQVRENPDNKSLNDWFDEHMAMGDIPRPADTTTVEKNLTVGGKQAILVSSSVRPLKTYYFADGLKIVIINETLADDYIPGFIQTFQLK